MKFGAKIVSKRKYILKEFVSKFLFILSGILLVFVFDRNFEGGLLKAWGLSWEFHIVAWGVGIGTLILSVVFHSSIYLVGSFSVDFDKQSLTFTHLDKETKISLKGISYFKVILNKNKDRRSYSRNFFDSTGNFIEFMHMGAVYRFEIFLDSIDEDMRALALEDEVQKYFGQISV